MRISDTGHACVPKQSTSACSTSTVTVYFSNLPINFYELLKNAQMQGSRNPEE